MKKIALFFLLGLLLVATQPIQAEERSTDNLVAVEAVGLDQYPTPLNPGDAAVDFNLTDFFDDSIKYSLSDFEGKIILLDMMASWCGPCQSAMPEMVRLYNMFASTNKLEFISIGIDQTEDDSDLEGFHTQFGIDWPFARDVDGAIGSGSVWDVYGSGYIPTYYLIHENGTVIRAEVGWYGIEEYYPQIAGVLDFTDNVDPEYVGYTADGELSINNPSVEISVEATDNVDVMSVVGTATYKDKVIEQEMYFNYATGKFEAKFLFTKEELYPADADVDFSFEITDWSGNSITVDGNSLSVIKIVDDTPPEFVFSRGIEYVTDTHFVEIDVSIVDVFLNNATLTVTKDDGSSEIFEHTKRSGSGTVKFKFEVTFELDEDITCYIFTVKVDDIAGNVGEEVVDVQLLEEPEEGFCVTEEPAAADSPYPFFAIFPALLVGYVISRRRKL
ncbi:MAG: TlpA family protein disulfide reductase [Candidatus Heimdallarchaeota archaeon]|nr:TlpA family protein disulfide reductase [Candidatus Heimdallarchaeota archaeon]